MTKTVLCVDDSASSRALMACALKPHGYTVVQAVDGTDGLGKMGAHKIDLVISDLNMPKMNGIEMIQAIRDDNRFDGVPIILMTAEGQKDELHKYKVVGITGWISKPFKLREICSLAKKLIG
ncbi:response regulator [Candidatus Halocynthiibacter alkanivorans]|uniref:response regulator n=1 Tax=Candidatus Halocynthiibacter alkanivorans TaxID=2267619 RepID=UPI001357E1E0|nr:response regulator [Candidatus Halocynthiibacter alkanivorans]